VSSDEWREVVLFRTGDAEISLQIFINEVLFCLIDIDDLLEIIELHGLVHFLQIDHLHNSLVDHLEQIAQKIE
jgi:hypothetical protein